jgi:hypothetical protein
MTLAALHVTKCRLCGQPPAGPGGLCMDCSRALARARHDPSAMRVGSPAGALRRQSVARIVLAAPIDPEPKPAPKRVGAALWATIGVVAVVVVLAATAYLSPTHPVDLKASERPARVATPLLEPVTKGEPAEEEPTTLPQDAAVPPSLPRVSMRAQPPRPVRSAAGGRGVTDPKPTSNATGVNAAAEAMPQPAPPMQQARVNAVSGPVSAGDGQSLATMLEKCSDENFLAGVICEQKVRLRYCEGKWGKVPQCTQQPHVD